MMASRARTVHLPDRLDRVLDVQPDDPGLSPRLVAILDRYAVIIQRAIPVMTRAEWCLVLDACNGWASWAESGQTLMMSVAHEVHDCVYMNAGDEKWGLSREQADALLRRLEDLGAAGKVAVVEVAERFWRRTATETDAALAEAGVVPSDMG